MPKIYLAVAVIAALITEPAAFAPAFADAHTPSSNLAALDRAAEATTARKVDLQVEPIQQPAEAAQSEQLPEQLPAAQPEMDPTPPANSVDAAADAAPESSGPGAASAPVTAKRICRKFSAAIAMVIEVPCESIN